MYDFTETEWKQLERAHALLVLHHPTADKREIMQDGARLIMSERASQRRDGHR
jgi:hypothetical protein